MVDSTKMLCPLSSINLYFDDDDDELMMTMMVMMMMVVLQSDHSSSYLRAARAGKLEKLLDLLDSGRANLTTANAVCSASFVVVIVVAAIMTTTYSSRWWTAQRCYVHFLTK